MQKDDVIYRQAALEAIRDCTDIFVTNLPTMIDKVDAQEALMEVPTAEPISQIKWERDTAIAQLEELGYGLGEKPKKGKWIDALDEDPCYYRCSECGRLSGFLENFCPECGADMRG